MNRLTAAALAALLVAPAAAQAADRYEIMGNDGKAVGAVTLTASPHGVLLDVDVKAGGLSEGPHGLHLHETADCSDVGQYKKSGSHAGHAEGKHGLLNPNGPEPGDLPNLIAAPDGSARAQLFTQLVKLDALKDENGSALIIHAQGDDHMSQPIGKSGDRVACAAVK
jgi:superoxide dismutase, Cu-Zn family